MQKLTQSKQQLPPELVGQSVASVTDICWGGLYHLISHGEKKNRELITVTRRNCNTIAGSSFQPAVRSII